MGGYAFRPSGCVDIHDPLYARAAVFVNTGKAIAILSADLIGLDDKIVDDVRAGIEREIGISAAAVMVNCTHTHGGPLTKSFRAMGHKSPDYIDWLMRQLVSVTREAARRPVQAHEIGFGRAPVSIGVNRRQYGVAPQETRIGVNPDGPVMPWVDVIVVKERPWTISGVLFSHACHPTTLGGENLSITADYVGYACDVIRAKLGPELMPLFLQGCSGNINPNPRGDFGWAKKHGEALGQAVLSAIRSAEPLSDGRIDYAETTIDLALEPPPPFEECAREAARWDEEALKCRESGNTGRLLYAEAMRDQALMEHEAETCDDDSFWATMRVQRLNLGPAHILGFPAEIFVQYGLDFDRQADGPVLSLGITNGVQGYVPVAADYPFGGYEVHGAHRFYGVLPFDRSCERDIRSAAYELLGIRNPDRTPYGIGPLPAE
jgi:neutral ceramidase